ncbi:hypothetical protein M8494_36340 [Serratia ureilytica]
MKQLPSAITEQQVHTLCIATGLSDDWKNYLWKTWQHTSQSLLALQSHENTQRAQPVEDLKENLANLVTYRDSLEAQAIQHELDAQKFDRVKASNEKLGLEAKNG